MRHRAPRPVLTRLRSFAATPRNAAVGVALLTAGAAAGAALSITDAPESARTGSTATAGQLPTDGATPSFPAPDTPTPSSGDSPAARRVDEGAREQERSRGAELATRSEPSPDEANAGGSSPEATPSAAREAEPPAESSSGSTGEPSTTAATRNANSHHWVIGLASDVEEATFECSLDGGAYESCESTVSYRDLSEGTHTFAARATGPDGTTDPTPARLTAEISGKGGG